MRLGQWAGAVRKLFDSAGLLRRFASNSTDTTARIQEISAIRSELAKCSSESLKEVGLSTNDVLTDIAVTAEVARRTIGLNMFDVQIHCALSLLDGKVAEMKTGEGKTLAAIPAIMWYARRGTGVHVMTANDYLAHRDSVWMGPIFEFRGVTVGCVQEHSDLEQRKHAYACDVTYATANEVGFDFLRDQLALYPSAQVHRGLSVAVIDEVDSILLDEARIPLVVAGGQITQDSLVHRADEVIRSLRPDLDYTIDEYEVNVALTDRGVAAVEKALECGNLHEPVNLDAHVAIQNALHAHALLRRDIDYLIKDGIVQSVDGFKGRVVRDRRWPSGLQTAIEVKERVAVKQQGKTLGSITIQNLANLYPEVCGLTGTAATQTDEFDSIYGLDVEVIPTNRPVIRVDYPDLVFDTVREKEDAVVADIRQLHETGRPVLVGTANVRESERLSSKHSAWGRRSCRGVALSGRRDSARSVS